MTIHKKMKTLMPKKVVMMTIATVRKKISVVKDNQVNKKKRVKKKTKRILAKKIIESISINDLYFAYVLIKFQHLN